MGLPSLQRILLMLPYNLKSYLRKKYSSSPSRSLIHIHSHCGFIRTFEWNIVNIWNRMCCAECYFRTGESTKTRKLAFFTTWQRRDPEPGTVHSNTVVALPWHGTVSHCNYGITSPEGSLPNLPQRNCTGSRTRVISPW